MKNFNTKADHINSNTKVIYIHDEKLGGWINVTMFLENLKHIIDTMEGKGNDRKDFNLIRLYYSSC